MSEQSRVSLSYIERTPWARYAVAILFLVIGTATISITWDDARASVSLLQLRIFLIGGVGLVWAVSAVTLPSGRGGDRREQGLSLRPADHGVVSRPRDCHDQLDRLDHARMVAVLGGLSTPGRTDPAGSQAPACSTKSTEENTATGQNVHECSA